MSLEINFIEKFGSEEAEKLITIAYSHKDMITNFPIDDQFTWAILVVIDFECYKNPEYRKHHGIEKISWEDLKQFCVENAKLIGDYKGMGPTFIGMFGGCFDFIWEAIKNE